MWTRSRSAASIWLCVPLPLPCTPMITYLRMSSAWHMKRGVGARGGIGGAGRASASQARRIRLLTSSRSSGQSSRSRCALRRKRATSFRRPWLITMLYSSSLACCLATSNSRNSCQLRCTGRTTVPCQGPCRSSSRSGSRLAGADKPVRRPMRELSTAGATLMAWKTRVRPTPPRPHRRRWTVPVWRFLVRPRWLGWHLLMVVSFWGMLWLGDWRVRPRAGRQRAQLGVHVRVALVRRVRRGLLGQDDQGRVPDQAGRDTRSPGGRRRG